MGFLPHDVFPRFTNRSWPELAPKAAIHHIVGDGKIGPGFENQSGQSHSLDTDSGLIGTTTATLPPTKRSCSTPVCGSCQARKALERAVDFARNQGQTQSNTKNTMVPWYILNMLHDTMRDAVQYPLSVPTPIPILSRMPPTFSVSPVH